MKNVFIIIIGYLYRVFIEIVKIIVCGCFCSIDEVSSIFIYLISWGKDVRIVFRKIKFKCIYSFMIFFLLLGVSIVIWLVFGL